MKAKINGCEMYYEVHGSGEPVLLVHGFPLSGRMWDPVVGGLAGAHRLIIPDLRGLGRSAATAETTMDEYVDDLVCLLHTIGERRPVVLVGQSMGGYVAFDVPSCSSGSQWAATWRLNSFETDAIGFGGLS